MTSTPLRVAIGGLSIALSGSLTMQLASAQSLTPAAQNVLKNLNLTPADLAGLDKELAIPQAWLDAAKKEGTLRVRLNLSDKHFQKLYEVFSARYPDIKIEYTRGVGADRATKPLLAFKSGRYITDVVSGFAGKYFEYKKAKALTSLTDIPGWNNIVQDMKSPDGDFVAYQLINWCTSYNIKKVKKADLPKTWDDILTDKQWRGGRVGIANRPQLWIAMLWQVKGGDYARNYMNSVFRDLKPQLRKEAINGMMKLASIGEFDLAIPSAGYRVKIQVKRGAPIAFHCPEPVPTATSSVGIFSGTPQINSARVFINWLLSKEGQFSLHNASGVRPSHKGLADLTGVLPYPEALKGKKLAVRTLETLTGVMPHMYKAWNKAWADHGGPARKRRRAR